MLPALVRFAAQRLSERYVRWLASSGYDDVQPAHSTVIQPLWEKPEGERLTALARASRVTKPSMSALVDHLEKRGYVERVPDPEDARANRVRLSSRGKALARALRGLAREIEEDWVARVGAKRVGDLRSTLELLRESWLSGTE
jgi:DNA-binding MarR family transcriptional regulator